VRNHFGFRGFLGGTVIAGLFAPPLVELVAPVIATAFIGACLRSNAGRRAAALDPSCRLTLASTMSIGCPMHV